MRWYLVVLSRYARFDGRAPRVELWTYLLVSALFGVILQVADRSLGLAGFQQVHQRFGDVVYYRSGPLFTVYLVATLLPTLAVVARRLHDIGRAGWWQLVAAVPLVGWLVCLFWFVRAGDPEANRWGAPPVTRGAPRAAG
jgi:uncharacterized membrane protein YhaH (DUF805 family)